MSFGNDKTNRLVDMHRDNKYYDELININLNTKNDSHAYLCKRVTKDSIVLDIGCAQGIIGNILNKECNCKVYGIELSKESIAIAEKTGNYMELYNFDIIKREGKDYDKFKKSKIKFDYIIFADVLEHLYDPGEALLFCFQYLKPNGKILISLPNIAHYDIIDGLLNDKFNYSEMGLLDNTHIRFFTKYSFAEYIKSIGEKYNNKIDLINFNSTIVKPSFYSNYSSLNNILKSHKDYLVLQNMFELIPNSKNTNNLDKLLGEHRENITKKIDDSLREFDELKKKYDKLVNDYSKIKNDNKRLNYEINDKNIYNRVNKYSSHNPIRIIDEMFKSKRNNKKSILFFVHTWKIINDKHATSIGGTTLHVLELINELKENSNCYVVTIINNKYMLVVIGKNKEYIYDLGITVKYDNYNGYDLDFYGTMISLIVNLQIDLIHVHHIINFPCDLSLLSQQVPTIFTIHDYSFLCHRYFLLDKDDNICNDYTYDKCKRCVENYSQSMYDIRKKSIESLLSNSKVVILPDDSILNKLRTVYNCKNVKIMPHALNYSSFAHFDKRTNLDVPDVLNVAFVGTIEGHKGGKIAKDFIDNCPENVNIHLFGIAFEDKYKENRKNYFYHGPYKKRNLPKLLNNNKIDVILFLNQCEESYSYTLSEAIYSGIPSISFNIGAIGNRILKGKVGWIIEKTDDYNKITYQLKQIKKDYKKIKNNVLKYHFDTTNEYASKLNEIYSQNKNNSNKNIHEQFQYLHRYSLYKVL